jgi:putative ABC transport system permease protein
MYRLTVTHILANKIRFALTTFGVTLAVSFVVSAFVLGDGLRHSFSDVAGDITAGIDLEVRNHAEFGDTPPLPAHTAGTVASVGGVADAAAVIEAAENAVRPYTPEGGTISTNGPPQLAFNWVDDAELSAFAIVAGAPPQPGEFTLDVDSATRHGYVIGDDYRLMTAAGERVLRLSGTSTFGAHNKTLGAVLMQMNTADAPELFGVDGITSVAVRLDDGTDATEVQAMVQRAVAADAPTAEVVHRDTVLDETTSEFTTEIDFVGNVLLGFGGLALFVSAFIIYNTFGIVLSQRTRELALLRTVGAGPRQILRSVIAEALVMGTLASAAGIGGGIAVAKGIDALFGMMGVDLSDWPLILDRRTLIAAAAVGIGVTVVAAVGPARRAASVPPVVAMRDPEVAGSHGVRRRVLTAAGLMGASVVLVGAALAGVGSGFTTVVAMAAAGVAIFLGVTALSTLAVGHVTAVVGWPIRIAGGVAGRLAQQNTTRNARRTSTTAAALMIGLTIVSMALVVGASIKGTMGTTFEHAAKAEYYVTDELDEVRFPASLADRIARSEAVDAVTGFTPLEARVHGTIGDVVAVDFTQIDALLDLDVRQGAMARGSGDSVVVSHETAQASGLGIGDRVAIQFATGEPRDLTVVGVFHDQAVVGEDYVIDTTVLDAAGIEATAEWLAVSIGDGVPDTQARAFVDELSAELPAAAVESADEFQARMTGMVDKILAMVNVMVGLTVVIALIGIANTLALSVFERTREIGLLRAVGMSRRQLRRTIRMEAALVAVFGAITGVGLGLLFGAGVVSVLPSTFASGISIPAVQIAVVVLVATVAGVVAAWLPARRAARLDPLAAIAL